MSDQYNVSISKFMEAAMNNYAISVVLRCAKKYGFDACEAIKFLDLGNHNMKVSVSFETDDVPVPQVIALRNATSIEPQTQQTTQTPTPTPTPKEQKIKEATIKLARISKKAKTTNLVAKAVKEATIKLARISKKAKTTNLVAKAVKEATDKEEISKKIAEAIFNELVPEEFDDCSVATKVVVSTIAPVMPAQAPTKRPSKVKKTIDCVDYWITSDDNVFKLDGNFVGTYDAKNNAIISDEDGRRR